MLLTAYDANGRNLFGADSSESESGSHEAFSTSQDGSTSDEEHSVHAHSLAGAATDTQSLGDCQDASKPMDDSPDSHDRNGRRSAAAGRIHARMGNVLDVLAQAAQAAEDGNPDAEALQVLHKMLATNECIHLQ